ncbi:flavin reductase family protein [Actinomadura madurae]|nr:flavin reductase family protein [Actinomadura madurae]MCQ0019733.1 flavin reductase family protein [Actinomadura madurae]
MLTVRDGRDDLGTTISSFMSLSLDPRWSWRAWRRSPTSPRS